MILISFCVYHTNVPGYHTICVTPLQLDVGNGKVLKLLKPLYGLKQSGRCWNATIKRYITSLNLKKSKLDPCINYKSDKKGRAMMMGLYVDDVLFAFHDDEELQNVTTELEERFSI